MNGFLLRFYTYENRQHQSLLVYEWLLDRARKLGIQGGSAFRAVAGYGRHGRIHEQHFFELAGEVPVLVEFIVTEPQATRMLELLRNEALHLFYAKVAAEYGDTGSVE